MDNGEPYAGTAGALMKGLLLWTFGFRNLLERYAFNSIRVRVISVYVIFHTF